MITSCFTFGGSDDAGQDQNGALVRWDHGRTLIARNRNEYIAYIDQVGAVNGLAYQHSTDRIYAGAFAKRHVGWGPGGSGAIYVLSNQQISPSDPSNVIQTILIPNAGSTVRAPSGWLTDANAFDIVGKEGLGDLELSTDDKTLWTIRLNDRHLFKVDVDLTGGSYGTVTDLGEIADPGCPGGAGDWRPFALEYYGGELYVGGVCSGETGNTDPVKFSHTDYSVMAGTDLTGNLTANILNVTNPQTSSAATSVFTQTDMTYNRGLANRLETNGESVGKWHPWHATFTPARYYTHWEGQPTWKLYPTPMLTDMEIDRDGSWILGFRDRMADQVGEDAPGPAGGALYRMRSGGDLIRVCWNGTTWEWEGTGTCPTNGNSEGEYDPPDPRGTAEFYLEDNFGELHQEVSQGGLYLFLETEQGPADVSEIVSTSMDPQGADAGGVRGYFNNNGTFYTGYEVFAGSSGQGLFGKANGLGDLEGICTLIHEPLEIGNRVWSDINGNGVQDPGEPPLAGVQVTLSDANGTLSTVTTDSNGNFIFSSNADKTDSGSADYDLAINLSTAYTITVPTTVNGNALTTQNADASANGDLRDSDADAAGVITLTTGTAGQNNHTFDIGYIAELVAIGNLVWIDDGAGGGTADDGIVNGTEAGLDGVEVQLFQGAVVSGLPLSTTTTSGGGFYLFDKLTEGDYVVHIPASQFAASAPLDGYSTSAPQGIDNTSDDNADENGQNTLDNGGISSTVINLVAGNEPMAEAGQGTYTGSLDDENVNMTVDFGFIPPVGTPSIEVEKVLNTTPSDPSFSVGETISFTIRITNTGDVVIDTLPLEDRYSQAFLTFVSANPAESNAANGIITWTDLLATDGDGLAPSEAVSVDVTFTTAADTSLLSAVPGCSSAGHTPNLARSVGGTAGATTVVQDDDDTSCDSVEILNPTAAQLAAHGIIQTPAGVLVRWSTVSENDFVGFNIWKSNGTDATLRSNGMIEATNAGQSNGSSYRWIDAGATLNRRDAYVLEIVMNDGTTERVVIDVMDGGVIFLPAVVK